MIYKPMGRESKIDCKTLAIADPEGFGTLTPGEFAERFGVPDDDQWKEISKVVVFDDRGRLRSVLLEPEIVCA